MGTGGLLSGQTRSGLGLETDFFGGLGARGCGGSASTWITVDLSHKQ